MDVSLEVSDHSPCVHLLVLLPAGKVDPHSAGPTALLLLGPQLINVPHQFNTVLNCPCQDCDLSVPVALFSLGIRPGCLCSEGA